MMMNTFKETDRMPTLFVGHGNPMNAIQDNIFTQGFSKMGEELPKPTAILCISAHWESRGSFVTAMEHPKTIHDFGGFPRALYEIEYPAPGCPDLALEVQKTISTTQIGLANDWGIDHGCWTVAKFMFPKADVPIVQLSIDYTKPASYHYLLAKELQSLRRKGIMIIGSGNAIHNLRLVDWENIDTLGFSYDWAKKVHEIIYQAIMNKNHQLLIDYDQQGDAFRLAVPTPDHYLPLLYILALQENDEQPIFFNDSIIAGSLDMMSLRFG